MMGDSSSVRPPDNPPTEAKGESRFWVPGVADEKLLRPDFATSWSKNKLWHKKLWEQILLKGSVLVPGCTMTMITDIGEKKMLQLAGRTMFKHLKERHTKERKSARELARDKKEKTVQGRKAKVSYRMVHILPKYLHTMVLQKAKARSEIRNQFPSLANKEYTFIFHKDWQSSDYTSDDSDLDDTAEGANGSASGLAIVKSEESKFPILKTCEPDYRSALVHIIHEL